jgi:methylmalonyl-CoA mutase
MNDEIQVYRPQNNVRVVTATSLFDGHDASINIFRRILQSTGVEVIHLGHNRSVKEIVDAAVQEDAQGIAISSYQGGHVEFFKYMVDLLKDGGAESYQGVRRRRRCHRPEEIKELEAYGVSKIYTPEDGTRMGLQGIINHMVQTMDYSRADETALDLSGLAPDNKLLVANLITTLAGQSPGKWSPGQISTRNSKRKSVSEKKGAGDRHHRHRRAGKSSLTDELILRMLHDLKDIRVAIISADPSRRKTGGALLGDRIRMNAIDSPRVYMRSWPPGVRIPKSPRPWASAGCGQGGRLRPGHRRNGRHRPGGFAHHRSGGSVHVCHDQRLRRRLPAGEDRHARFRRSRGGQQVRKTRR